MSFEELEQSVITWSNKRGLIHGTTAHHQVVKLMEELGELSGAILRGDHEAMVDGVGDCCVVLINLVEKLKLGGVVWCLESAYDEIKDRKGQMVNGTFIKETDYFEGFPKKSNLPPDTEDEHLLCLGCGEKVFNLDYPNDGLCPRCLETMTVGQLHSRQQSEDKSDPPSIGDGCFKGMTVGEAYTALQCRELRICKRCEDRIIPAGCCDGLCEACRQFYLDECQNDFGLDI